MLSHGYVALVYKEVRQNKPHIPDVATPALINKGYQLTTDTSVNPKDKYLGSLMIIISQGSFSQASLDRRSHYSDFEAWVQWWSMFETKK